MIALAFLFFCTTQILVKGTRLNNKKILFNFSIYIDCSVHILLSLVHYFLHTGRVFACMLICIIYMYMCLLACSCAFCVSYLDPVDSWTLDAPQHVLGTDKINERYI